MSLQPDDYTKTDIVSTGVKFIQFDFSWDVH